MPCESCHKNFTLLRRKKACGECKRLFCVNCLVCVKKIQKELVLCERCRILTSRPIQVSEVHKLKPKDLIFYLQSKQISTAGCVEKDELVNLVVIYANNSQFHESPPMSPPGGGGTAQASSPSGDTQGNPFEQIRQTCTTLFTSFSDKLAADFQQFTPQPFRATPAPPPPRPQQPPPAPRPEAGPSREQESPRSDVSSSFEDIGAVGGQSPESWQFLNGDSRPGGGQSSSSATMSNEQTKHSVESDETADLRPRRVINRRRSDSDLVQDAKNAKIDLQSVLADAVDIKNRGEMKCDRCNEAIKSRATELRLALDSASQLDLEENRRRLDEFLLFLESDAKRHSIPHSPEERQICEELGLSSALDGVSSSDDLMSSSAPSTSRRVTSPLPTPKIFDRSKRVNLSDISTEEDFEYLSVKQLKEILTLNRVDYKGCCEKEELMERVVRLWRNHSSNPVPDKLPADDLCKICMDAPIECIYLECGHLVACLACSKVLSECPVCRQYIARVVRFFRV